MKFCTLCRRAAVQGSRCSHDGSLLAEFEVPAPPVSVPRYRAVEVAARGATGIIYQAQESSSGKTVGLKLVSQDVGLNPAVMHRVRRETKNTIKLANPHVVRVLECGDVEGQFFVVREWLEGHPLAVAMVREGPMEVSRAAAVAHQLCVALGLVHRIGLVHRDVKPNHVFLSASADGALVKLIDTALAAPLTSRVGTREVVGTAAYIAPEQAEGKLASFRSDLYSLGALLFHMLVGRPPYEGTESEVVDQHLSATPPAADQCRADIPPGFARLIERLMARQPASRPFSAATVQRELEQLVPSCTAPIALLVEPDVVAPAAAGAGAQFQPSGEFDGGDMGMAATLFGDTVDAPVIKAPARQRTSPVAGTPPGVAVAQGTPLPTPPPGQAAGASPGGAMPQRTILGMPGLPPGQLAALRDATPAPAPAGPAQPGGEDSEYGSAPTVAAQALQLPVASGGPGVSGDGGGAPAGTGTLPLHGGPAHGQSPAPGASPSMPLAAPPAGAAPPVAAGWAGPQGVNPQGISPQGFTPQGISPQGFTPQGVTPPGARGQGGPVQGGWSTSTKFVVVALVVALFVMLVTAIAVGALVCSRLPRAEVPLRGAPESVVSVAVPVERARLSSARFWSGAPEIVP